jgi:hypothetical protein
MIRFLKPALEAAAHPGRIQIPTFSRYGHGGGNLIGGPVRIHAFSV